MACGGKFEQQKKEQRKFSLARIEQKNEMGGDDQKKTATDSQLKILLLLYREQTVDGGYIDRTGEKPLGQ